MTTNHESRSNKSKIDFYSIISHLNQRLNLIHLGIKIASFKGVLLSPPALNFSAFPTRRLTSPDTQNKTQSRRRSDTPGGAARVPCKSPPRLLCHAGSGQHLSSRQILSARPGTWTNVVPLSDTFLWEWTKHGPKPHLSPKRGSVIESKMDFYRRQAWCCAVRGK